MKKNTKKNKPQVGIIMGSASDLSVMEQASAILDEFGVCWEVKVLSAHRSPELVRKYASSASLRGLSIIIAGAGGAAHLAGVVAAHTILPVIGVPVESKSLRGLDSLLSTAQMPKGVPVATVAIDGAANAAILALECMALSDKQLQNKLHKYKRSLVNRTKKANQQLEPRVRSSK